MIEEVGGDDEEGGTPLLDTAIGDGGGNVSLAATAGPQQHQPASGLVRELAGCGHAEGEALLVAGVAAAARFDEVVEGEAGKGAQVAVAAQPGGTLLRALLDDAAAGQSLPEVGVAQGDRRPDEAGAAAEGAGRLPGGRSLLVSGGPGPGIFPRAGPGAWVPSQYLLQLAHSRVLPPPIAPKCGPRIASSSC